MSDPDHVRFFDTTLRDGEQSPGVSLNPHEKLEIAEQLARLNVDVIEAGFPIASEGDFEGVKMIAERVRGPIVAGLARAGEKDIDCAARAVAGAAKPRIHTFVSTSPTHLKYQLRMNQAQVLKLAERSVRQARSLCADVEFSAMDATRSDVGYLIEVYSAAIEAGATTLNVPDTVGYALPDEMERLVATLIKKTNGGKRKQIVWSVHCHDDLGLAVANSLAAVRAGARQVEVAVNGIGERAGNASLEEIAMAIRTRKDLLGVTHQLDTRRIGDTSRKVSMLTGYNVQRNKAIVGANAFMHESGIHQDGVLKERSTYEIMRAEDVGHQAENIVLGKHSGRHAFSSKLEEMGIYLDGDALDRAFRRFKSVADAKKTVSYRDIEAIALAEIGKVVDAFQMESYQSFSGEAMMPMAAVRLAKDGKTIEASATGDGQVDALCNAISRATRFKGKLIRYAVSATTEGLDSLGEVALTVEEEGGMQMSGRGLATDVIAASARAYLNAINRLHQKKLAERKTPAKKAAAKKTAKKKTAAHPKAKA